jgi:hypothetical protein
VAELLGIPPDELTTSPGRAERRTALRTIKQLRGQLKDLDDHSKITRLVTFVVRLALVIDSVPESAGPLAPIALDRYAEAMPDPQRDWPFPQKLEFWQQTHKSLKTRTNT